MTALPPLIALARGQKVRLRKAATIRPKETRLGVPDLVLFSPSGKIHLLELKRNGENLSPSQEEFRYWAIRTGVPFVTAHSFTEALVALDEWGVLRIKIAAPGNQGGAI